MKTIMALIVGTLIGAATISWVNYQPNQQAEKKMLLFTANWCRPCQVLKNGALKDSRVVEASKNYLCVLVDADRHKRVLRDYKIKGLPTIVFVTNGKETGRVVGVVSAKQLLKRMR